MPESHRPDLYAEIVCGILEEYHLSYVVSSPSASIPYANITIDGRNIVIHVYGHEWKILTRQYGAIEYGNHFATGGWFSFGDITDPKWRATEFRCAMNLLISMSSLIM